jgi:hypothetical protein
MVLQLSHKHTLYILSYLITIVILEGAKFESVQLRFYLSPQHNRNIGILYQSINCYYSGRYYRFFFFFFLCV